MADPDAPPGDPLLDFAGQILDIQSAVSVLAELLIDAGMITRAEMRQQVLARSQDIKQRFAVFMAAREEWEAMRDRLPDA